MIAIDNAIAAVETHRKRIDATAASTHMANRSLDKARAELEKGAASEIAVLNAERELREARLREKSAVVDQRKALLALWDTTGTLLERQGIEVANLRTPAPTGAAGRSASAPGLNPRARDRR